MEKYLIYIPAETYAIADALISFNQTSHLKWQARVRLVLSSFEYQEDFNTISRRSLAPVYRRCVLLPEEQRTFGDILMVMWEFLSDDAGIKFCLAGDKTPYNTTSVNLIGRGFPNAHYVFITRHPYDVCRSYLKMGRYTDIERAAERWKTSHTYWSKFSRKEEYKTMLVRYEDLVMHPSFIVAGIGDWLQIEERLEELDQNVFWGDFEAYHHHARVKSEVDRKSIGKGFKELSASELETIRKVVGSTADQYGHEL